MQKLSALTSQKVQALGECPYFTTLNERLRHQLAENTHLYQYERDEVLFWQGEPCPGLFILEKGGVKLFKLSPQGRELIVRVLQEGTTFEEVPVFDGGTNPVNAAALETSLVWVVETASVQKLISEHPDLCRQTILNLASNLRMLVGIVEELSFYQVTHRLARLLSQLTPEQLSGSTAVRLKQDDLAARLGTVREVVARSLRELERSGAIHMKRGQITITDEKALQAWLP
ncbi:MAG: Crp/Fnr family transcriptional regulator [Chloroflexota bacterium]